IKPTDEKKYIVSVTGGGIHPVAEKIAEETGGIAVDGFEKSVPKEEMAAAVINCGGTARSGVYPRLGVLTVNTFSNTPSGQLLKFIKEDNFVSGVDVKHVESADDTETATEEKTSESEDKEDSLLNKDVAKRVKEEAKEAVAQTENGNGNHKKKNPIMK